MNPADKKSGVYRSLDAWRGVASLWVVLYHVTLPIADANPAIRASPAYWLSRYGCFGVWMFFVISGYCIANAACQALPRPGGLGSYFQARLRRIYPPCWFSALLYFAFSASASLLVAHGKLRSSALASQNVLHQGPLYYFANLTLTQKLLHQEYLQGVYWTLCYEVAFYLVIGAVLFLNLRRGSETALLNALHALTLACLAVLLVFPTVKVYPFDLWPYFGFGALVYDLICSPRKVFSRWALAACGTVILLLAILRSKSSGLLDAGGGASLLFTFGFALALLALHRYEARLLTAAPVKWLSWVGLFSYSLYLTHYMIISIVSKAFERKGVAGSLYPLCLLVSVAAAVAFARLFFQFCEMPFIKSRRRQNPEIAPHSVPKPDSAPRPAAVP